MKQGAWASEMEGNREIDAGEGVKQGAGASEMEENREIDA